MIYIYSPLAEEIVAPFESVGNGMLAHVAITKFVTLKIQAPKQTSILTISFIQFSFHFKMYVYLTTFAIEHTHTQTEHTHYHICINKTRITRLCTLLQRSYTFLRYLQFSSHHLEFNTNTYILY